MLKAIVRPRLVPAQVVALGAIGLLLVSIAAALGAPIARCTPMCEPLFRLAQTSGIAGAMGAFAAVVSALRPTPIA